MSDSWVEACAKSGAFVEPREHLLQDPAAEKKFGFSLAGAHDAAQQGLLLSGVSVLLTPGVWSLKELPSCLFPPVRCKGPSCHVASSTPVDRAAGTVEIASFRVQGSVSTACHT